MPFAVAPIVQRKRLLPKNRLKQLLEANSYAVTENLHDRKGRYRIIEKREDV